jgi:hypothetical protein
MEPQGKKCFRRQELFSGYILNIVKSFLGSMWHVAGMGQDASVLVLPRITCRGRYKG